jgi:hypothetical protein
MELPTSTIGFFASTAASAGIATGIHRSIELN